MSEQDQLPVVVEAGDPARDIVAEGQREDEGATLPALQQKALEFLVAGKSVAETGRLIGVGRTTMFRWLKRDAEFRAAYNRWHTEIESNCQSRLMTMTDKAMDAVERALEMGNARAALELLKGMGMLNGRSGVAGPTEAEEIRRRDERERSRRELEDLRTELGI